MTIHDDFVSEPKNTLAKADPGKQELVKGTVCGRYIIVEPIGSGGMGTVYRAYDPKLNRGIALKVLSGRKGDSQLATRAKARLKREAQALAQLSHPNVVAVHDVGTFADDIFIAMELIDGKSLDKWLKEKEHTVKEVLQVMISAGRGLAQAHKVGLVHRDFKPGNVMVGKDGRVRVLDFGLARMTEDEPTEASVTNRNLLGDRAYISGSTTNMLQTPITKMSSIVGTPLYMSPEQYLGLKVDERTDQFAFCLVLYEALYGQRPFSVRTREELRAALLFGQVNPPPKDTDVPSWLWSVTRKGLRKNPSERYQNLDLLLGDLQSDPIEERTKAKKAGVRKVVMISLVVLMISSTIGVWHGLRYKKAQSCKDTKSDLIGVWDDTTKASVQKAFLESQLSYAQSTWKRVKTNFDNYIDRWNQMRSDVCEAKWLSTTLPEGSFDFRMSCLKKRLREIGSLVEVFIKADAEVVQNASKASSSFIQLSKCMDEKVLSASYPPPKTAQDKEEVELIRKQLSKVQALEKTGKYRQGLQLATKLEKYAKKTGYLPVQAETLHYLGNFHAWLGNYEIAQTIYQDAIVKAVESNNALLAANIMHEFAWVVGYDLARHTEGISIGRAGFVILGLAGGDDVAQAQLYNNIGVIHKKESKYTKAIAYYNKVLALWKKTLGAEHGKVAIVLMNLGNANQSLGEYDKALAYLLRALAITEKTLGPQHPQMAVVFDNLGDTNNSLGEYDKALTYYRRALAIYEKNVSLDHPWAAWPLCGIGQVYVYLGKPKQALDPLEKVIELCGKKVCESAPYGDGLFSLARVLMKTDSDQNRAIKLAKKARELFEKTPKAFKKELEEVDDWLSKYEK